MKYNVGDKFEHYTGMVLSIIRKDIASYLLIIDKSNSTVFLTERKLDEEYKLINEGGVQVKPSLITRLMDKETALIQKEVMDSEGNLNMQDPRVQEALLQTDGFRNNLLTILKKDDDCDCSNHKK